VEDEPTGEAGRRLDLGFERLQRSERLSDRVAALLLRKILDSELQPGDRLLAERELAIQFGVSRTVVREAVRSLAARGVVTVRPGAGLTVAQVDSSMAREAFGLLMRRSPRLRHDAIQEVRLAIEVEVAGLAAQRATDDDVAALRRSVRHHRDVFDDLEKAVFADMAFHIELARCTHNELFVVMLDSLGDVMFQFRLQAMKRLDDRKIGLVDHPRILEAVAARDVLEARAAMTEHISRTDRAFVGEQDGPER
jgi:GntR family transcriptional regulator, transcriptional repressor for pyruvate dehydrogenase complex